jgi:hypothetical protein
MFNKLAKERLKQLENVSTKKDSELKRDAAFLAIESGQFAQDFALWVRNVAKTEKDTKVLVEPWVDDWNKINGDLRLNDVVISGAAQVYKSLGSYLLNFYITEYGNLNTLYTFAKSKIRDKIVASTVTPFRIANRQLLPQPEKLITENNQVYKTRSYTSYYSFVVQNGAATDVAVPAELQSISVDVMLLDEYSQYNPKIAAVLKSRQANSLLESRPVRYVSTPGKAGTTIDILLNRCSKTFSAFVKCPHCGQNASLHPEHCFLKKATITDDSGDEVESFFDSELRVLDWYHSNPDDRINSAYLSCQHCGGELPDKLYEKAFLLEKDSQMSVDEFIDEVNEDPTKLRTIGLIANPFLRRTKQNIAVRFANDASTTENYRDFIEQGLGIPSNDAFNGLTVEMLTALVNAPKQPANPTQYSKTRLVGLDVARGINYACLMDVYIPTTGSKDSKYHNAIRSVVSFDKVASSNMVNWRQMYKPEAIGMDLNPDQSLAFEFSKKFKAIPFVQKHNLKEVFREDKETNVGGLTFTSYSFDNQYFITRALKLFRMKTGDDYAVRLPRNLTQYLTTRTKNDAISHLLNMTYNDEKAMWEKGSLNRSDYFYAFLFAEVLLYQQIVSKTDNSWLNFF